jgi:hypothetical protein
LDALGEVFNVRFETRQFENDTGIDAWLLHNIDREDMHWIAKSEHPCFAIIRGDNLGNCGESRSVEFSADSVLPSVLHGRRVECDGAAEVKALPKWLRNISVIASKGGEPIWGIQHASGNLHHYTSLLLQELGDGEALFQLFQGREFLRLLPLFLFLRGLVDDPRWDPPPLQACFMFDDPNLHWPRYGFIDFEGMAKHAKRYIYHASFATIPLDAWFVHKPTASLFQRHRNEISLLIHGNDHTTNELGRFYPERERKRILMQALSRIAKLERRAGVEVSRVMAAPHGACSEGFLKDMSEMEFEAVSVSGGSLKRHNPGANFVRTFGIGHADIVAGLPVFPRFRLSGSSHNSILIAALLRRPIIPVGHHQDASEGLHLLEGLSTFINSLGKVQWGSMTRISRSQYAQRAEGKILRIRMYTKRITVDVPDDINEIWIERYWLKGIESEPLAWRVYKESSDWKFHNTEEPIPVNPGQTIEILSNIKIYPEVNDDYNRRLFLWAIGRRQLTEARDRLAPLLRRVSRLFPNYTNRLSK